MNYLFLFLASFSSVFLIGIQQLNIQGRRYIASAITSVGITIANYLLYKYLPNGDFQVLQLSMFSLGAMTGITTSMYVYDKLLVGNGRNPKSLP